MAQTELNASNFRGEEKMVEIEGLQLLEELQGRDLSDPEVKAKFKTRHAEVAEALKDGREIDRIFVGEIGEGQTKPDGTPVLPGRYVLDGFVRTGGYKAAGRSKIPAIVRKVTWQEAIDVATSANADQVAMPRTVEDKRRAVEMSLKNHWLRSVRWHAGHCVVSQPFVEKIKKEVEKTIDPAVVEAAKHERVGKDGRKQKVAKKKTKAPAKSAADWAGMEQRLGWLNRFLDAAADLEGKPKNFKAIADTFNDAGEMMLEWRDNVVAARKAEADAAKAKAEEEKEAKAAKKEAEKAKTAEKAGKEKE